MDLEKTLLRKVGEAVSRFKMIRDGDRVAVALSGGKDSLTMLEALILLQQRAPIQFTVCAFTVEQGKFLRPFEPMGEYLKNRGIDWTYYHDRPSFRLLHEQPEHGCDLCSRYRRRAVYEIVRGLGANVIAFGHTADDFCESFLRNALFTGRVSSLPPVTWSRQRDFRLIRPLVYVTEDLTARFVESFGSAADSLRLLGAYRHCSPHAYGSFSRASKRIILTSKKPCFRPWGISRPGGCSILAFWISKAARKPTRWSSSLNERLQARC